MSLNVEEMMKKKELYQKKLEMYTDHMGEVFLRAHENPQLSLNVKIKEYFDRIPDKKDAVKAYLNDLIQ